MPRESSVRDQVRTLITQRLGGMVTNHEDKFTKGVADTSFAFRTASALCASDGESLVVKFFRGWIEFKNHPSWPKLWSTELRLGIRGEQRIWNRQRWLHARDNFFIIRIDKDIYMFTGQYTDILYHPISRSKFESIWVGKWKTQINSTEFVGILQDHLP